SIEIESISELNEDDFAIAVNICKEEIYILNGHNKVYVNKSLILNTSVVEILEGDLIGIFSNKCDENQNYEAEFRLLRASKSANNSITEEVQIAPVIEILDSDDEDSIEITERIVANIDLSDEFSEDEYIAKKMYGEDLPNDDEIICVDEQNLIEKWRREKFKPIVKQEPIDGELDLKQIKSEMESLPNDEETKIRSK
uniref:Uncharacterized protein n=1 Tax=Megaselia scalaris TaxID=36166 RepID=T1GCQ7_MEGSC